MARKYLTNIDMGQNQILNVVIQNLGSDPGSPVTGQFWYNTTANELKYYNGSSIEVVGTSSTSGTVTTISVASSNGFAGTVANATTTPIITLTTSVTGILKGNGTAISAATSGTDYAPATTGTSILKASSGGFTNAVAGTDYVSPTGSGASLTGITVSQVSGAAPTANPTFTGTVTIPTTVNATDAAQKQYVDAAVNGISSKYSAFAATVGTETFTVTSGTVTTISGTALDGTSPSVGAYLLIKDAPASTGTGSTNSTEPGNGLYIVTNSTTNLSVSRATDMSGTIGPAGSYVFVESGTVNANAGFFVTTPTTNTGFTYGTNNVSWTQFTGAGEITAGTGLSKSGNTLSLSSPVTVANGGTGATTLTGIIKGNGTSAFTVATSGTDYVIPSGNVATATALATARNINGVSFNGTANITIPATVKYATNVGDGSSTSYTITHSLGTTDVITQVYTVSGGAVVECDVVNTSTSVVTLTFATAPSSSQYRVVVIG